MFCKPHSLFILAPADNIYLNLEPLQHLPNLTRTLLTVHAVREPHELQTFPEMQLEIKSQAHFSRRLTAAAHHMIFQLSKAWHWQAVISPA